MSFDPLLTAKNLGFHYVTKRAFFKRDTHKVFSNLNFEVNRGETLGIVGRNGSGKSTLLRILAGIYPPSTGGLVSTADSIALMTLSLVFEPTLSGRDNALFGGMLLGFSKEKVESQLYEIESFSGLNQYFEEPVKTYSSGMMARLAFAIAVNLSPDVMLLDEVLAVGDEDFRQRAYQRMMQKIRSNQTTVLVSHSAEEVISLCDRAILLEAGQIEAQGDPTEVIAAYRELLAH